MARIKFGTFLAPHHPIGENPFLQFRRDIALVERLEELGYDEFWCGEHHSSGWEMIASPEMFLAAAAERTRPLRPPAQLRSTTPRTARTRSPRTGSANWSTSSPGSVRLGTGRRRERRSSSCSPARSRPGRTPGGDGVRAAASSSARGPAASPRCACGSSRHGWRSSGWRCRPRTGNSRGCCTCPGRAPSHG